MAKKQAKVVSNYVRFENKKTSTSGNPEMVKTSSMNKNKRRSYKMYRGQGR